MKQQPDQPPPDTVAPVEALTVPAPPLVQVLPEPTYLDRTQPDRARFYERIRPQVTADHIKDLLRRGGPILSLAVPASLSSGYTSDSTPFVTIPIGVGEPRWRPGRDRPGTGGGPPDASNNVEDFIYLDIPWSEVVEMIGLLFDLPFLIAKDSDRLKAAGFKIRGLTKTGPQMRKDDEATFIARLERWKATYNARPEDFPDLSLDDIPSIEQFPYALADDRFKRVEVVFEPDAKAVAFLLLDTSGSMFGEAIAIARFYFLLNLIWLRSRYEEVEIVYIPHGGVPLRVETEHEFFSFDANGGTDFVPAYNLAAEIAEREFPISQYNRYLMQATDGQEDNPYLVARRLERLVDPGGEDFKYIGICIVDTWWSGSWQSLLEAAFELVSEEAKVHIGLGKAQSQDDVPEAMRQILTKDKTAAK